jgi:hypothetical protein
MSVGAYMKIIKHDRYKTACGERGSVQTPTHGGYFNCLIVEMGISAIVILRDLVSL